MSNINVSLDCRNWAPTQGDGYTLSTSSISTSYGYKFSGGSDGNGNVTEYTDDGSGQGTITVTSGGDPRYIINNVQFIGDNHTDMSWTHGAASNIAIITDSNVDNENVYYNVTVQDTTANCLFICDPDINNTTKPR